MQTASQQDNRLPFLWGTQEQRIQVAAIPVTPGLKAATVRIPKNGYLSKLTFRFVGAANVTVAGTAGTPNVTNIISSYILSYNGGFQYRSLDGESMAVMHLARYAGSSDPVYNGPSYKTYNPASVTNQSIGFVVADQIGLNTQVNADKYLLAAQARNADITLDVTFAPTSSVVANTETVALSGTLYVEGLFLLDPPDYSKFKQPDLTRVQQIVTDTSYTNVVLGDNTIPITPVNGPKYLQLFVKGTFNGVPDVGGYSSAITRFQLKINNGLNRYDLSPQALQQENCEQLGRVQVGPSTAQTQGCLPPGWFMFDFLNDSSINNAVSAVGRNVISTEKIASLWLIPTVANGTNLAANNSFKLIKRVELPAVG